MSTEQVTQNETSSDAVLGMADDDLSKMTLDEFVKAHGSPEEQQEAEAEQPDEKELQEDSEEAEEPDSEENEVEEEPELPEPGEPERPVYAESGSSSEDEDEEEPEEERAQPEESGIDYKAEYEKLLSPFRASKRDMQVRSVDDARRLMQMGADYQYKMQALKPQLKIMRSLEKNGLLDVDKINFLIDLDKKNPEAIKKFLKEKQIDPMELDLDAEGSYEPQNYAPSDKELAVDEVLDEIRHTDSFNRTVKELSENWDEPSKQLLMDNPALIKVLNEQIGNGIYDQVRAVVDSERMLGRLPGLNDLMAYKTVGDALQAQGALKPIGTESEPQRKPAPDPKLKARKRAASPTKKAKPQVGPQDFNPLAMSDEEFEKLGTGTFG